MTNVPVLPCFRIAVPVCETGSSHGRAWATALSRDRARRYRLLPGATRDVRQAVQPVHLWSSWNGEDGLFELRASRTQGELWQQVAERLCNRRILWNTVGRSRNPPRHLSCRANTICFYHVIIHFSYSVSISPSRILRSQNFTQNQGNSAVFGGVCDFFQIAAGLGSGVSRDLIMTRIRTLLTRVRRTCFPTNVTAKDRVKHSPAIAVSPI